MQKFTSFGCTDIGMRKFSLWQKLSTWKYKNLTSNQSVFSIMNSILKTSPPLGPNFISSSSITSWDEHWKDIKILFSRRRGLISRLEKSYLKSFGSSSQSHPLRTTLYISFNNRFQIIIGFLKGFLVNKLKKVNNSMSHWFLRGGEGILEFNVQFFPFHKSLKIHPLVIFSSWNFITRRSYPYS